MATEIGGLIYGKYGGSSRQQVPGGLTFENSYMPHGGKLQLEQALSSLVKMASVDEHPQIETYETWLKATTESLEKVLVGTESLGFMLHISSHLSLTTFAMERHNCIRPQRVELWDNVKAHFYDHIPAINKMLIEKGLSTVVSTAAKKST